MVWYKGFLYQAASWKTARRVVAKVEFHFGELFPRVGFIVTNLETPSRAVVRFYNKRGTAEQWIKEGKQAVKMTRLSCHRFRSNQVRLGLSLLAYNLGNLWRRLALPKRIENWSLTSLQQRLVKTGGRLVKTCALLLAAAGGEPSDAAALRQHAAADRGAAVAGGIRRAQSGAIFDDDAEAKGEVPAESMQRTGLFQALRCPPEAKTAPLGVAGNTADQNRPNLAQEGRLVYSASWNRSVKMMWMDPAPFSKTAS